MIFLRNKNKQKYFTKYFYPQAVSKEMEVLFGSRWHMHVIIKPPWTLVDVLKCAIKHWIAAVSESFNRRCENNLKDLLENIKNPPAGGRKLKDVKFFLDKCEDVVETMNTSKYPTLKPQMLAEINVIQLDFFNNFLFLTQ